MNVMKRQNRIPLKDNFKVTRARGLEATCSIAAVPASEGTAGA
jgi:hypothetical protein